MLGMLLELGTTTALLTLPVMFLPRMPPSLALLQLLQEQSQTLMLALLQMLPPLLAALPSLRPWRLVQQ